MKRVLLTALAEFDLIEAQDFYAPNGDWVVSHFGPFWPLWQIVRFCLPPPLRFLRRPVPHWLLSYFHTFTFSHFQIIPVLAPQKHLALSAPLW